ncbi:MAG: cytochrome c [Candidatus Eisenbacteria bacterium]|nr:cytochrome c [Candidatus Eisenbacteria bacterium]
MNRFLAVLLLLALPIMAGCGQKPAETTPAEPAATPAVDTAAAPAAQLLEKSLYDEGPRAAEGAVDAAMAAAGEKLFATKGCIACHTYGKKMTGPDLKGVTHRRTALWLEHQIMHPEVMTKTDPIAHALMAESNNVQMLNLHLTQPEARSLIEYFKKLDRAK